MKTEKDLSPAKKNTYLKAMSALEMRNYGFVVTLMAPMVAEEPEFIAGRKLLREASILRSRGGRSAFRKISIGSIGKSKSQKALEAGQWKEAMDEAEKVLEDDPFNKQANEDLHEAAEVVAKKERDAIKNTLQPAFDNAVEEGKAEAAKNLDAARDRQHTFEAIAVFALETISQDAKNVKARHEVGKYLMQIEKYDDASRVFEDLLKANPMDLEARDRAKEAAARRSMQRGKLGTSTFADLVKQRQQAAQSGEEKVVTAGDTPEELAQRIYEAHEAGTPDREAARTLADLYYNREDYDNALQYYQYLSGLAEGTDPGLLRKISDSEVRRISKSIIQKEKEIADLAADDPAVAELRGEIAELRRCKAEQTLGEARKRVERNPADLQYRFELGEQLVMAAHYKEAIPELQKARTSPNTRTRALYLLGKCYTERNMLDLAAKTLMDAASEITGMDGTKKDILYSLGLVYERMGDKDKSLDCMKQIYEVDYEYLDVAERVEASYMS